MIWIKRLIFVPALLAWLVFAPSFRAANYLSKKLKLPEDGSSLWFWFMVEAKDHDTFYDGYDCE